MEKHSQRALDLAKFCFAVKALNCFGLVIKYNHEPLFKGQMKMVFNRILTPCLEFDKMLEKGLGENYSKEEDMNTMLVDLISKIIDAPDEERAKFTKYLNDYAQ